MVLTALKNCSWKLNSWTFHLLLCCWKGMLRFNCSCCCCCCCSSLCASGHKEEDLEEADRFYLSDDYKRQVVSHMSISQLIEICLINPTVTLLPSYRCTAACRLEPALIHNPWGSSVHEDTTALGQEQLHASRESSENRCLRGKVSLTPLPLSNDQQHTVGVVELASATLQVAE